MYIYIYIYIYHTYDDTQLLCMTQPTVRVFHLIPMALVTALCAACTDVVDGSLRISFWSPHVDHMEPIHHLDVRLKLGSVYERHMVIHGYTVYFIISQEKGEPKGLSFDFGLDLWLPDAFIFWLVVANLPERKLGLCERMDGLMDDIQKLLTI